MKIFYGLVITVLLSGYAFSAEILRPKDVLNSGYHYPGKPDSEENMILNRLLMQQGPRPRKFRADSPCPAKIEVIKPDGIEVKNEK